MVGKVWTRDQDVMKSKRRPTTTYKKGGRAKLRVGGNTARMNRLEELGRVDAERGRTRKGKRNLREAKRRIVKELKK